ncbi:MAG: sensor histidine kinase [Nitrospinota bacterium]
MKQKDSFFERWSKKSQLARDRGFYLIALPLIIITVAIAPHLFQVIFFPQIRLEVLKVSSLTIASAVVVSIMLYFLTQWLSRPTVWGASRHRWPIISHVLVLWIPVTFFVDAPQRAAELLIVLDDISDWLYMAPYTIGISMTRTFLFAGGIVFFERLIGTTLEIEKKKAEALSLRSDVMRNLIQPHFLLNSLNIIRAHLDEGKVEASSEMLNRLTSLFRKVLNHSSLEMIPLPLEIETIKDYIAIMNIRYEANFTLCADQVEKFGVLVPPLIFFSLVENSFKHGFSSRKEGRIDIEIDPKKFLSISVIDNGESINKDKIEAGIGDQFIVTRLQKLYKDQFELETRFRDDGGYEVKIRIPWMPITER